MTEALTEPVPAVKHRCARFLRLAAQYEGYIALSSGSDNIYQFAYRDKRYMARKLSNHLARCQECAP